MRAFIIFWSLSYPPVSPWVRLSCPVRQLFCPFFLCLLHVTSRPVPSRLIPYRPSDPVPSRPLRSRPVPSGPIPTRPVPVYNVPSGPALPHVCNNTLCRCGRGSRAASDPPSGRHAPPPPLTAIAASTNTRSHLARRSGIAAPVKPSAGQRPGLQPSHARLPPRLARSPDFRASPPRRLPSAGRHTTHRKIHVHEEQLTPSLHRPVSSGFSPPTSCRFAVRCQS